ITSGLINGQTISNAANFTGTVAVATSVSTPSLISTGALGITPAAGSNLNINLSTTGDFAVNTNQLYVDTSTGRVGVGTITPSQALEIGAGGRLSLQKTDNAYNHQIYTTDSAELYFVGQSTLVAELVGSQVSLG